MANDLPDLVYVEQADLYYSEGDVGMRALLEAKKRVGEVGKAVVSRPTKDFLGEEIVGIKSFQFYELEEKFPEIPDGGTVEVGGNHLELSPGKEAFGRGEEYVRELEDKYPGEKIVLLRQCVSQACKDISRVLLRRGKSARIVVNTGMCVPFGGEVSLWEGLPMIEYLGCDGRNGYGRVL